MKIDSKSYDSELDLHSLSNERKLSNAAKTIINKVITEHSTPRVTPRLQQLHLNHSQTTSINHSHHKNKTE